MKQKKYKITENKDMAHNSWYTGKNTTMSITNKYLKQGYHMLKRQQKAIG